MNVSLRARLVAGIVVLLTCGLLVADVSGVVLLRSYLLRRLDQQLSAPFDPPPQDEVVDVCSAPPAGRPAGRQLPTAFVLTILDRAGAVRCRLPDTLSSSDDVPALDGLDADGLSGLAGSGTITTVPGTRAASAGWRVRVVGSGQGYMVVAVSLADVRATVNRLVLLTTSSSLVILGLAVVGGFLLVRVALRPLTAIEETAAAIAAGDLSRRVEPGPDGTEVGRLSASLNTMLGQIEEAFDDRTESEERLRRFVADASHELRTPLATIRGHAELYRQGVATAPEQVGGLLSRIESESVRMGALVEDLLLLARLDAAPQLQRRPVDLLSLAADVVADARLHEPGRPVTLVPRRGAGWADEPPVVDADEARLRQVVANLLGNALRHTPPGTPVEVDVGVREGVAVLRVVDHGPGLRPAVAERVFERFYRDDSGRHRDRGGTGLGLAIVRSIVDAHEGRVWYEPTPGGGSRFVVSLSIHPEAPAIGRDGAGSG